MPRRLSMQVSTWRRFAAAAVALAAAVGLMSVSSAAPASPSQAERLRAIETARVDALVGGDVATARRLTAPDFQLINPGGALLSRDDLLGAVQGGGIDFLAIDPTSPIAVRMSGDAATLRYQAAFDLVVGGTHLAHDAWTTALYERRGGRWQLVWEQTTAIPNDPELFLRSISPAG